MKTGYSHILPDEEHQNETIAPSSLSSSHIVNKKGAVLFAVIFGIACLLAYTSSFHGANGIDILESPVLSTVKIPDCSAKECFISGCPEGAPYHCHDNNGCSASPWSDSTCDDQCTLENCSHEIPSSAGSCEDVQCSAEWCKIGQKCGLTAPYQCLDGSSRFGCNGDEYGWTIKTGDNVCSKCCDIRTCS